MSVTDIPLARWAEFREVSSQRARVWAAEGRIPAYRLGKRWFVPWRTKRPQPIDRTKVKK